MLDSSVKKLEVNPEDEIYQGRILEEQEALRLWRENYRS